MTWILILTLAHAGTTYQGAAIHSVPGLGSKTSCEVAGEEWISNLHKDDRSLASVSCIEGRHKGP